jgi:hypothetical protein
MPGWALGSDRLGKKWRFTLEDVNGKHVTLSYASKDMLYKWHHLAAVRDRKFGKVRLYIDGVLRDEKQDPTANVTNGKPFLCGKDCMVGGGYWGLLDEAAYFPTPLSKEEIAEFAKKNPK